MSAPQNTIALIFDFDDTLTDDSTTRLLEEHGVDGADFWKNQFAPLVDDGWDPTPAYLKLILDLVGDGKPMGLASNRSLREFGKQLKFYPGLPGLFKDLSDQVRQHTLSNPTIEFYVISGGLEEIILGSSIAKHLTAVRGCRFAESDGVISAIENMVTFTEKTRYLFEISKGPLTQNRPNPYAVNNNVEQQNRRIPFSNMIYVGDGLTDVPCFSLLQKFGGKAFGVFDPKSRGRRGRPGSNWWHPSESAHSIPQNIERPTILARCFALPCKESAMHLTCELEQPSAALLTLRRPRSGSQSACAPS